MKYTVITYEATRTGRGRELERYETDDIQRAVKTKIYNTHNKVGVATKIINNETKKEVGVRTRTNTRVYGLYIKMY
ncbi:MAG: hypothetical protein J6T10_18805 [Methanobrevibacter sp.]|nr:hypothetical protein [Methanobrevibacter sp.]